MTQRDNLPFGYHANYTNSTQAERVFHERMHGFSSDARINCENAEKYFSKARGCHTSSTQKHNTNSYQPLYTPAELTSGAGASRQATSFKPLKPSAKTKNLPALGEPGGLDDPLRRGLSGAKVKWYLRFLKQGYPPEEAKKKAMELKSQNPNTDCIQAQKRKNETIPQFQRPDIMRKKESVVDRCSEVIPVKRSKTAKPSFAPAGNVVRVAILSKNFPRDKLQPQQLTALEDCILSEIAKGHTTALIFEGIHFRPGYLLINCGNESTADWLRSTATRLQNWTGVELMACFNADIPKTRSISLFLPRSAGQSQERALGLLKAQNSSISPTLWKITQFKDEGNGQLMLALIDEESFELIKCSGFELNYRFGKIPVRMVKSKFNDSDNFGEEEQFAERANERNEC